MTGPTPDPTTAGLSASSRSGNRSFPIGAPMSDPTVTPTPTEARQDVRGVLLSLVDDVEIAANNATITLDVRRVMGKISTLRAAIKAAPLAPSPAVSAPDLDAMESCAARRLWEIDPDSVGGFWDDHPDYPGGHEPTRRHFGRVAHEALEAAGVPALLAALAAAHAETERLLASIDGVTAERDTYEADADHLRVTVNSTAYALADEANRHHATAAERDEARAALAALREAAEAARQALTKDFHDGPFVQEAFDILRAALAAAPSETEEGR